MGAGQPLPYINGWLAFFLTFSLLYLVASLPSPLTPYLVGAANTIASLFPAPFNGFKSTGLAILALGLTLGIKLMDAPRRLPALRYRSDPANLRTVDTILRGPQKRLTPLRYRSQPGGGQRFATLESKLSKNPKIDNPAAVAASIGRAKYGKKRFQRLSSIGRRRRSQ